MSSLPYRLGDSGPAIAEIRAKLAQIGMLPGHCGPADPRSEGPEAHAPASDEFDARLDLAVRHFQQDRGLMANGVVDPATYRLLDEARWRLGDRLLSYVVANPQVGDDVVALQRRLTELGFDGGQVDGVFGARTDEAVRELQRNIGLSADGTCGPSTFKALGRLAPLVTGGRPDSLRASEALRRAGKRLPGKVVVIDPGHGGDDKGNVANGLAEAEIVADLAARIEGRLAATGVRTFLTRGPAADHDLDERERASFANTSGANLVISLHADAHANPEASGVATYYFGGDRPGTISAIGEQFAGLVQREIVARTDLLDCRSHPKTWDLLRHTTMAAVRIDLGYVTSPGDALRLADADFRDVVAEAIVVAVQRVYLPRNEDAQTGVLHLRDLAQA